MGILQTEHKLKTDILRSSRKLKVFLKWKLHEKMEPRMKKYFEISIRATLELPVFPNDLKNNGHMRMAMGSGHVDDADKSISRKSSPLAKTCRRNSP